MPLIGDTVRLKAEFRTFAGIVADPTDITLKVYNAYRRQIGEAIAIGPEHRTGPGAYQYDYTLPEGTDVIYYEWSGMLEGLPVVARGRMPALWV